MELINKIYIPIMVWLILLIIYLVLLSKKFTFGNWTKNNPNPFEGETMAMPRGVMRGILTLTLLFTVILLEVYVITNPEFETHMAQLMVAFQMMLAFYFGSKVMHHLTSTDRTKTTHVADVMAKVEKTKIGAEVIESISSDFDDKEAIG